LLDYLHAYNVAIRVGDGTYGWKEESPFDAILVTAGAPKIPAVLVEQLTIGGRLIIPVGDRHTQTLTKATRLSEKIGDVKKEDLGGCRFVDLIGEYGWDS
jgi:protein-L-isoaspartate(D-aspartate) O-methyltransferase